MPRHYHLILVAAAVLASVGLLPLSAQGREPTARWASLNRGQPAWKAWWELQRPRLEWIQTGTICYEQNELLRAPARLMPSRRDSDAARKALTEQLGHETNTAVLAGTLIALGKIGSLPEATSSLVDTLLPFLRRPEPRTREAAWIALVALADPASASIASEVLSDSARGREVAGATPVDERTRAFAAYALARIVVHSSAVPLTRASSGALRTVLGAAPGPMLQVACIQALGLSIDEKSDIDALEFLLAFGADATRSPYARGQAALALAHGMEPLRDEAAHTWRARAADEFRRWIDAPESPAALRRQTVLALGRLGAQRDTPEWMEAVVGELRRVAEHENDDALAGEAFLGLGQASEGLFATTPERTGELARFLIAHLDARPALRPWAALACGRMAWELHTPVNDPASAPETLALLRAVVREHLRSAGSATESFVIAANLAGDAEAYAWAVERASDSEGNLPPRQLADFLGSVPRGQAETQTWNVAGARTALRALAARTSDDAETFYTVCRARARIDDEAVASELLAALTEAKDPARRASLLDALGASEDARAVKPLLGIAVDADAAPILRAHALSALGELLDKEPRLWSARFAEDLDPLDAPPTLIAADGTGLLDYR